MFMIIEEDPNDTTQVFWGWYLVDAVEIDISFQLYTIEIKVSK